MFSKLFEKSYILQNLDFVIFGAVIALLLGSLTVPSEAVGGGIFAIFVMTLLKILANREKITITKTQWWLIVYFLIVFISLCGSSLFSLSLKGFIKTVLYIVFYFSVTNLFKTNIKYAIGTVFVIAAGVILESGISWLQNFSHVEMISGWQDVSNLNPEQIMTRVYGTLKPYNPNLLGGYFVAGLPAVLGCGLILWVKKYYKLAVIFFIGTFLGTTALIYTGCRGAYLAFIAMLIAITGIGLKFFWANYKKICTAIIGFGVTMVSALIIASSSLRARIFSIFAMRSDSSNSFRFNVYQASWQMFKDNWLLGIGIGNKNFREIYGLYMKTGFDALSAYNIYLETAVESGIFALITFLIYLGLQIYNSLKFIFTSKETVEVLLVITAFLSLVGLMAHGFVDTVFYRPQIQIIFWVMMAIITVAAERN
ncbi:O-antigen ligase family protein [bacterium]|nr:O-antigen ligase family protein [bacterium]